MNREQIHLSEITADEIEIIVDIKTDLSLWPFDYDATSDKAYMRNVMTDRFNDPLYHQYLIKLSDETIVGEVHIHSFEDDRNIWEVGYCVYPQFRRQGYCAEAVQIALDYAFTRWGVYKVVAFCNEYNIGSYKVMEKCGMVRDAVLRGELPWNGRRVNQYYYSILEDEYRAQRNREMPRWEKSELTALCMVYDGDKILLQDRIRKNSRDNWQGFTFPGGHIEKGESFVEGVRREILEETGLRILNPKLCGIKQFQTEEDERYIVLLFRTDQFEGELRSSEEGKMHWVRRGELMNYPLVDDFMEHLKAFDDDSVTEMYYGRAGTPESGFEWNLKLY